MKRVAIKIGILVICILNAFALNASHLLLTCEAAFTYQSYQGSNPSSTGITFTNLSTGTNLTYAWDFGDGTFSSDGMDTLDHFYMSEGLYNACLTVWDDQGCSNTFCGEVIVGDLVDVCNIADCVWPGDANKDGEANFYDLLKLGIGHGATGSVRPNATTNWVGQIAPDWTESTVDGINYKHLDCDGNGIIDDNDIDAINGNYVTMTAANPTAEFGAPLIHIEFDQDTIYVDNITGPSVEVIARLKVGTADFPADNIYGLALYLGYPEDLVYEDSVFFYYENNSFFGPEQEVLWMPSHQYAESQLDVGVARNDGTPVGGFGEIGQGVFIIVSDIIDTRVANGDVNFPVHVNGVRMIDSLGNELPVNLSPEPTTLVFSKLGETSSVDDTGIANAIFISPNPTSENVLLNTSYLNATEVELFDSFGRAIFRQSIRDKNTALSMKGLNTGIYFIKVHTDKGIITKRVMKQ